MQELEPIRVYLTELRNIFLLTIRLRHTGTHYAFGSKIHYYSSKSICPIKLALVLNLGEPQMAGTCNKTVQITVLSKHVFLGQ